MNKKQKIITISGIAGIVAITAIIIINQQYLDIKSISEIKVTESKILIDENTTKIDTEKKNSTVQANIEEGLMRITISPEIELKADKQEGEFGIKNHESNRNPQRIEIRVNETEEIIYETKAIPVGSEIQNSKLIKDLAIGTHTCTAYVTEIDEETGEDLGTAGAIIRITITE